MNKKFEKFINSKKLSNLEAYPCSLGEQMMYNANEILPGSNNMTYALPIKGDLDIQVLKLCFSIIIERHEILRTKFIKINNVIHHIITTGHEIKMNFDDLSKLSKNRLPYNLTKIANYENLLPFDLECGRPLRIRVIKISKREFILILTLAHIVCDQWSLAIIVGEIIKNYSNLKLKKSYLPTPELSIQMKNQVLAENLALQRIDIKNRIKCLSFFKEFPVAKSIASSSNLNFNERQFGILKASLISSEVLRITEVAKENDLSFFAIMIGAFCKTLQEFTNQSKFIIAIPYSGRQLVELRDTVGCIFRVIPVAVNLENCRSVIDAAKVTSDFYKKFRDDLVVTTLLPEVASKIKTIFNFRVIPSKQIIENPEGGRGFNFSEILYSETYLDRCNMRFNSKPILELNTQRAGIPVELNFIQYQMKGALHIHVWHNRALNFESPDLKTFVNKYIEMLKSTL